MMNAYKVLSNYSFGFYNFVDLTDEVIPVLNNYMSSLMLMDPRDNAYWVDFLKNVQNEYIVSMLADITNEAIFDFEIDLDTYYGDKQEEIDCFELGITHEERAEEYRRMYHPSVGERVFDAWKTEYVKFYILGFSNAEPGDDDFDFSDNEAMNWNDAFATFNTFEEKPRFAHTNIQLINEKFAKRNHHLHFRNQIAEELIANVMHPCRIQNQMNQFDDIEQFFTAMGC
ncbi:hypothetical protein PF007_g13463 [Phytophthora fragariae]|uniref:Uncharacterized protein n=1 Tax=Phytophthora fragariae TaxID=53985 RepID=A0A6A3RY75_9STRA|nr:hypothetical protein PF006_g21668 [Phytophthora fragariae]KAE9106267.1 hypothetical protein PF007_g13463 [Phytophthora fragariae]